MRISLNFKLFICTVKRDYFFYYSGKNSMINFQIIFEFTKDFFVMVATFKIVLKKSKVKFLRKQFNFVSVSKF